MKSGAVITNTSFPTKEERLFSFLAVFLMFGNVYVFPLVPVLGMGEVFFILFIPYFLVKIHNSFTVETNNRGFILFMIYGFIITLIMGIVFRADYYKICTRLLRDFFYYFLIFYLGSKLFCKETFFKWLIIFSIALSVFVILQSLVYFIFGYFIPGFPLNLQINDGGHIGRESYDAYLSYARIAGYLKPNGFLCEPAHCAQCFFVALIMLFFYSKATYKKLIPLVILISLAALLTMSTSAFLYVAISWILWLIKERRTNVLKVIFILFLGGIILVVLYKWGAISKFASVINRFTNLFTGDKITDSTSLRIQKGMTIFKNLPLQNQIWGIGFGTYFAAYQYSIISENVTMASNEYMNSFSYIWVSSGIIGGIILLFSFLRLFCSRDILGKMMIITLLTMSLGAAIYSSPICVWLMLVILKSPKIKSEVD